MYYNGIVDQASYRASGSYKTYKIINIGTEITELGKECFSYSSELRTINFESPSQVTKIGDSILDTCEKLESFNIPDSVEIIGSKILRKCGLIKNFYIGPSVKSIGEAIIYGSSAFKGFQVDSQNLYYSNDTYGALYNTDQSILYLVPSGCSSDYEVPNTVVELSAHCFHGLTSLREIKIPNSVVKLGSYLCQYNTYSTTMIFQERIQIENISEYVFHQWEGLISIELPESIKLLPSHAFENCWNLKEIYIPSTVETIENNCFTGCNSISIIKISEENDNFESQDGVIFNKGKTEMLIVPISVKNLTIPAECTTLPSTGLQSASSLTSIQVDPGNSNFTSDGQLVYQGKTLLLCIGGASDVSVNESTTEISRRAFSSNNKIEEIDLSQTRITLINDNAFEFARKLERVICPSSLKTISTNAFTNCLSLTNITFSFDGKNNLEIMYSCFTYCSNLKSIILPSNLVKIYSNAFTYSGLQEVIFSDESRLIEIQEYAFSNCQIQEIQFPDSLETIGQNAFESNQLTKITFGNNLTTIDSYAFTNNTNLINVTFPSDCFITNIKSAAFSLCTSLTNFTIPASVSNIEPSVFERCISLTDLFVSDEGSNLTQKDGIIYSDDYTTLIICPNGKISANVDSLVVHIGNNAFYGCIKLEQLLFEKDSNEMSSLQTIGSDTFYNCKSLESVHFPNTLINVSENAFLGCSNLISLDFGEKSQLKFLGPKTFSGCTQLKNVTLPTECNLTELSESIFEGCSSLQTITIPNSVAQISEGCFRNCISLTNISFNINESLLTTIGPEAFFGCSNIRIIKLPDSLKNINSGAFSSCSKLQSVFYCGINQISTPDVFNNCHHSLKINVKQSYPYNTFCNVPVTWSLNENCVCIPVPTNFYQSSILRAKISTFTIILIITSKNKK